MNRKLRWTITAILLAALILPSAALSSDLRAGSSTYLHVYQVDEPIGPDSEYRTLYEYLTLDVFEAGDPDLSVHLYGWARKDLGDDPPDGSTGGYLASGHLRYGYRPGVGQVRLGRLFLTEGTAVESLDGVHVRHSLGRSGIAFFGGSPNGGEDTEDLRGDTIFGARTFYVIPGRLEVGLNYLSEDGDYAGDDREEAGTDIWLKPLESLEITGRALYNLSTSGLASEDLTMRLSVSENLEVTAGTEGYRYEDLLQSVTNPAFLSSRIDPGDEVRITVGEVRWSLTPRLGLRAARKNTDHLMDDPGDSARTEVGLDIEPPALLDRVGVRAADQTSDLPENEYRELRVFAMSSLGPLSLAVDALTMMYEEMISGEDRTVQVIGSAGWSLSRDLLISGDVRFTKSPVYEEDLAVFFRAHYDFGGGS